MSAFMVSDAHIDFLATAYVQHVNKAADPQLVGAALILENARSIEARYGGASGGQAFAQAHAYRYRPWAEPLGSVVRVAKQISCLEYQSCEHDEWQSSKAQAILVDLLAALAPKGEGAGKDWEHRSGWDCAEWGIPEPPRP